MSLRMAKPSLILTSTMAYTFHIDAEVDAVQTHNAKDAIKECLGRGRKCIR